MNIGAVVRDIPVLADCEKITKVEKGWSRDRKYYVENSSGERLLLRLSDMELYGNKEQEYRAMQRASSLGIRMSQPIDFGLAGGYVYTLLSWIDGTDAGEAIPVLPDERQYAYGVEAGRILRRFHAIAAPDAVEDWERRMRAKFSYHLQAYRDSGIRVPHDGSAISYIDSHMSLLKDRPQVFQHGDFHTGNLIMTPRGELGVIDFNRWDYGDPYEDFYKLGLFSREVSIPFARGQIDGYFDRDVPDDFFPLLALYLADVILYSVVWAISHGEEEVAGMLRRAEMILRDYDHFHRDVPAWY